MFDEKKKKERESQLKQVKRHGGVLISSYGMISSERNGLTDSRYDVVVIDEGHKAKNRNT